MKLAGRRRYGEKLDLGNGISLFAGGTGVSWVVGGESGVARECILTRFLCAAAQQSLVCDGESSRTEGEAR
jgi:hypothetical protein